MSKAHLCVRGKFYFILLPIAYNNYGATIIILYRPLTRSASGGGGNEEKTVAGASCAAVPHSADVATPLLVTPTPRGSRRTFSSDRREDLRSTEHRPVAAAICGCVVGGTGCSCRVCVYVRACAVLIECDANIRNIIICFFFVSI